MKKNLITAVLIIILGVLIGFGPRSLFKVCGSSMNMGSTEMQEMNSADCEDENCVKDYSACHWTAQAELGVGIVIIILGVLLLVLKAEGTKLGLLIAISVNGIYALAIPTVLIGVCESTHMRCHSLTKPALVITSIILLLICVIRIFIDVKNKDTAHE